jgi:hypothetical protein
VSEESEEKNIKKTVEIRETLHLCFYGEHKKGTQKIAELVKKM